MNRKKIIRVLICFVLASSVATFITQATTTALIIETVVYTIYAIVSAITFVLYVMRKDK